MALDPVDDETGSVEYVVGSHKWEKHRDGMNGNDPRVSEKSPPLDVDTSFSFHDCTVANYRHAIPAHANVAPTTTVVPQGHAILHHQDVWHGSGPNRSTTRHRRALVVHYIRDYVQFRDHHDDTGSTVRSTPWGSSSYIYGRDRKFGSTQVEEDFFPILYADPNKSDRKRTIWLDEYIS